MINFSFTANQAYPIGLPQELIAGIINLLNTGTMTNTLTRYTVATLPAAGTAGRRAFVTDATAPTFLATLTGGGAVVCPVFDNGTAWVSC